MTARHGDREVTASVRGVGPSGFNGDGAGRGLLGRHWLISLGCLPFDVEIVQVAHMYVKRDLVLGVRSNLATLCKCIKLSRLRRTL